MNIAPGGQKKQRGHKLQNNSDPLVFPALPDQGNVQDGEQQLDSLEASFDLIESMFDDEAAEGSDDAKDDHMAFMDALAASVPNTVNTDAAAAVAPASELENPGNEMNLAIGKDKDQDASDIGSGLDVCDAFSLFEFDFDPVDDDDEVDLDDEDGGSDDGAAGPPATPAAIHEEPQNVPAAGDGASAASSGSAGISGTGNGNSGNASIIESLPGPRESTAAAKPTPKAKASLMKCMLCIIGVETADEEGDPAYAYVVALTETSSKGHLLERTWKSILMKDGSWWKDQVNEVLSTASQTLMAKKDVELMKALLEKKLDSLELLEDSLNAYKALDGKIRKFQLQGYAKALCDKFIGAAREIVDGKSSIALSTKVIDLLTDGLSLFQQFEGAMSTSETLLTWVNKKAKDIVKCDLAYILERISSDKVQPDQIDFSDVKRLLDKAAKFPAELDPKYQAMSQSALLKMIKGISHKAL
eukprot:g23342.t1